MADAKSNDIVMLGGSYGGISSAHYTLRHVLPALPDSSNFRVVLISPSPEVMCRPACPRGLLSDEALDRTKLFVGIEENFKQYGERFAFIKGTAVHLDHIARNISIKAATGDTQTITFYALIIATGASTPSPLYGLYPDAETLRSTWVRFREAFASARTILIAGGGPTGVETAGELGEFLNGRGGWFGGQKEPKVKITLVTAGAQLLPLLRPAIAARAEALLANVGVTVVKNARVGAVSPETAGTADVTAGAKVTLEDGRVLEADLYIPAMGMKPNTGFVDQLLLQADGRIQTTSALRVEKAGPRIYAVGDVASAARPAVHNVMAAVPVLGANMKRDLLLDAGVEEDGVAVERQLVEDKREMQLVPIGRSKGVGAAFGYQVPSFMVWMIKGRDYWVGMTGNLWNGKNWAKET